MARKDDKTEKPTPKRKREARRKGQVARSPDVSAWVIGLLGSMLLPVIIRSASGRLTALFGEATTVMAAPSAGTALQVLESGLGMVLVTVAPITAAFAAAGVVANLAQSGLVFSAQAAAPKWDHLNPLTGIKNLLSPQSAWQLGKQFLKLAVLVLVAYRSLDTLNHRLMGSAPVDMTPVIGYASSEILGLVRDVSAIALALGLADYAFQRRRLNNNLKMTRREVRDETRQSEGDPLMKSARRRRQIRMSRSRMMAAVVGADLVVTNPTHFSVALRYDPQAGSAPRVVAKGADELAARIREQAARHHVPIVEDPPLARAVYAACEVDDYIPAELYMAVARLLAFVFTLPHAVKAAVPVHRRPTTALVA